MSLKNCLLKLMGLPMTIDMRTIEAFDRWWTTKPEPHISSPQQCYVQQDKVMAIWLSAWDAATKENNEKAQTR